MSAARRRSGQARPPQPKAIPTPASLICDDCGDETDKNYAVVLLQSAKVACHNDETLCEGCADEVLEATRSNEARRERETDAVRDALLTTIPAGDRAALKGAAETFCQTLVYARVNEMLMEAYSLARRTAFRDAKEALERSAQKSQEGFRIDETWWEGCDAGHESAMAALVEAESVGTSTALADAQTIPTQDPQDPLVVALQTATSEEARVIYDALSAWVENEEVDGDPKNPHPLLGAGQAMLWKLDAGEEELLGIHVQTPDGPSPNDPGDIEPPACACGEHRAGMCPDCL